jgi:predicted phage terminase large subunit-like protein
MTTAPREICLHPAQKAFLHSDVLYRGFVGGIGCGKSWIGSWDLIRRSRPGRLYMVLAPTYAMLADSTFRSFLAVTDQLGLAETGDVKRSPPPSIKLATGAEVLFRSTDDPERLRGPNLSGAWMDEASLMHADTFAIVIGRLREQGEQGWLSATFTPKGKAHWTYHTFATGRPDTAIFRARTRDNPFLPKNFYGSIRQQYTSALAAQELEGAFVDLAGALFQRDWFAVVDQVPGLRTTTRAWDLAATPKSPDKANDPDWTAGVLVGRAHDGTFYVLDVRRLRGTPQAVQGLVARTAAQDGKRTRIAMEQEPGSSGVAVIDHYRRAVLPGWAFYGLRSTGSKADRARPLAAQAEGGNVKLLRAAWNNDFLDEIEFFPFGAHDDQVDAATLAFNELCDGGGFFDGWPTQANIDYEPRRRPSILEPTRKYHPHLEPHGSSRRIWDR